MGRLLRRLSGVILACAMLLSAVPAVAAESARADWALYVYMCGSDLESEEGASTNDLMEMLTADYPENVRVLVFTGGSTEWDPKGAAERFAEAGAIEKDAYIRPSGEHNQLFEIKGGRMELLKTYDAYMDMGDPATGEAFLKDAVALAPAEHAMLEFWDHGTAVAGGMNDQISGHSLSLAEMRDVVAAASRIHGSKLDVVGFDACVMSTLEVATLLSPYAEYLVASEEVEPDKGWNYEFLNLFSEAGGSVTARELGEEIINTYADSVTDDYDWTHCLTGTLALTDLSRVGAVETAFQALSDALLSQIKNELNRGETKTFVDFVRIAETAQSMYAGTGMIDLYDLTYRVKRDIPSLSGAADRVIAALGAPPGANAADYAGKVSPKNYLGRTVGESPAVLYRGTGYSFNNCVGLSVYYPLANTMIPLAYVQAKVYPELGWDSYEEIVAEEYLDGANVPVFDGEVRTEASEKYFTLSFSSEEQAKGVRQVEYVTTYSEFDGEEMTTYLLGSELLPDDWRDGSLRQVPYETWYALGEHFITVEPISFEAQSEITGYDAYTYWIYGMIGDKNGGEEMAMLQVIRSVAPGQETSGAGMELVCAVPISGGEDVAVERYLMPENIAYVRPAVAKYDLESQEITDFEVYDERVELQDGNILPVFVAGIISDDTTSFEAYFKVTDLKGNTYLSDPYAYFVIQSFDEFKLGVIFPQTYTGWPVCPAVRLLYHGQEGLLQKGTEYTVAYSDNVEKGTATVTVTSLIDELPGTLTTTFTICDAVYVTEELARLLPEHALFDGCEDEAYEYMEHVNILENVWYFHTFGLPLTERSAAKLNEQYAAYEEKVGTLRDNGVEAFGAFRAFGYPEGGLKLSAKSARPARGNALAALRTASATAEELLACYQVEIGVGAGDGAYTPRGSTVLDTVSLKLPLPKDCDVEALDGHMRAYILTEDSDQPTEIAPARLYATELGREKCISVTTGELGYIAVFRAEPLTFSDVPESGELYDAVSWAVYNGTTNGNGDGLFLPDAICTRAQMVTFLWRAYDQPVVYGTGSPFNDVDANSPYYRAIQWGVENGITGGVGDGAFDPDALCTRAQMVTFLWRAAGRPDASGSETFSDVDASSYYADAVAWAAENGITNGTGDGLFSPDDICTRAQAVVFIYRMA